MKHYASEAEQAVNNSGKLKRLFNAASAKLKTVADNSQFQSIKQNLSIMVRLVGAYSRGEYRDIPRKTVLGVAGALIYFVTPLDAVPDFIPIGGLVDDFGVLSWVISSMRGELEKFRKWEAAA